MRQIPFRAVGDVGLSDGFELAFVKEVIQVKGIDSIPLLEKYYIDR